MEPGSKKQISSHNKNLKVPPNSRHPPDGINHQLYHLCKRSKLSDEKNVDDQHTQEYLQNDNTKVSIDILNDDCLRHIFEFLSILDRIRIERVCTRWKAMSLESWRTIRGSDFSSSEWGSINRRNICHSVLRKLLLRCGRFLTQFTLLEFHLWLDDNTLDTIGQLCPNLTSVDFFGIRCTASSINALATNCKNITRLVVENSSENLDNELSNLFMHNNMEYLEIRTNNLWGKCLTFLSAETMQTLILYNCYCICEDYLCRTLEKLRCLEKLVIDDCHELSEDILRSISQCCTNLTTLDLGGKYHPKATASLNLTNLVKLKNIRIAYNKEISDDFITNMVLNCRELVDVDITGCWNVTDAGLASIATLPKLERLNIGLPYDITDEGLRPFVINNVGMQRS